jgi:hypothetical protein
MSRTVFVSYSSKDQAMAETICHALETRGLACWIASRDVHPGENFMQAIVKAIRAAKVMVLVFSNNANNSEEIKKELVLASQSKLVIMPVRIEDVVPDDAFTYQFATSQWIDTFKGWEQQIERLVSRIRELIPEEPTVAERASSTLQPGSEAMRAGETTTAAGYPMPPAREGQRGSGSSNVSGAACEAIGKKLLPARSLFFCCPSWRRSVWLSFPKVMPGCFGNASQDRVCTAGAFSIEARQSIQPK